MTLPLSSMKQLLPTDLHTVNGMVNGGSAPTISSHVVTNGCNGGNAKARRHDVHSKKLSRGLKRVMVRYGPILLLLWRDVIIQLVTSVIRPSKRSTSSSPSSSLATAALTHERLSSALWRTFVILLSSSSLTSSYIIAIRQRLGIPSHIYNAGLLAWLQWSASAPSSLVPLRSTPLGTIPDMLCLFESTSSLMSWSNTPSRLWFHSQVLPLFAGLSLLFLYHEQPQTLFAGFVRFCYGIYGENFSLITPPLGKMEMTLTQALSLSDNIRHSRRALPTLMRVFLLFQLIISPMLRGRSPTLRLHDATMASRTAIAIWLMALVAYILSKWRISSSVILSVIVRMIITYPSSQLHWICGRREMQQTLSIFLANMCYGWINLLGDKLTSTNGTLVLRLFTMIYPVMASYGIVTSPATSIITKLLPHD
jgi:hypothetical protein